jgi:hypothetical protein
VPPCDSVLLGNQPVVSESIRFFSLTGEAISINFKFKGGAPAVVYFNPPLQDSMLLRFQSIDFLPPLRVAFRDTSIILPSEKVGQTLNPEDLYQSSRVNNFSPFKALNSQGSLSRSISLGNNQDAVLNSALNLQLSGDIGNRTQIRASISDNTVPVQAEGYTQQLRDFDRVYLELENPDFGLLRAGDYNVSHGQSTFLNFEKRISGGGVQTKVAVGAKSENGRIPQLSVQAEGGLARGRFARNRFQGEEGNQGPYKLRGANGEQFIIIISGSERVYIDGLLLTRGQKNDYVIDYNAGELSFTALQPITRDKRIVIEFQYTEQNYLRSVFFGKTEWQSEAWQSSVQYYTEQDSKDQPLSGDLSGSEREALAVAGDNIDLARISTISPAAYDPSLVQYQLIDSLGLDSILIFSQDSNVVLYNASFAFVGQGKGYYQLVSSTANGRVFEWAAPVNGVLQGAYAAVRTLVAPNRLQVIAFQSAGQWGENKSHALNVELAASNNRLNLFSNLDRSNDDGAAGKIGYQWQPQLKKGSLQLAANYEFNNPGFTTVERLRSIEFARDWNLPVQYQGALQVGGLNLKYQRDSTIYKSISEFLNAPDRQGWRQAFELSWRDSSWIGNMKASLTQTETSIVRESFWREQLASRYFWRKNSWLGVKSIGELNQKMVLNDSLAASSYSFLEYQLFQGFGDTAHSFMEFGFLQRYDDSVRVKDLEPFTYAYTMFGRGAWRNRYKGKLNVSAYYRNLQVLQPSEQTLQRTLTTRFNYQQGFFENALRSQTFYESGAGTEPRRSFTFIEVPAGTGTHTHVDYNQNGLRELDEFEVAPTPDLATFVRVFSPNLEFIRTSSVKFGQTINLQAPRSWQSAQEGARLFWRKFSALSAYQLDRRTLLQGGLNELNPFGRVINDSLLVARTNSFRQSVFFNRSQLGFGADYGFNRTANRNLLSFGIEERQLSEHRINLRYGFNQSFILRLQGNVQDKLNRSGNFTQRNYDLGILGQELSLSYQDGSKLTLTGSMQMRQEASTGANENELRAQEYRLNLNYNVAKSIVLQSETAYIFNQFDGDVNSPAAYEMLQAFRPGDNLAISLSVQRTFLKNIVLSLSYAGRFSPETFAIHTGNVQVKAFF